MMPSEERERHTLVGSHSQATGSEAQPKRQLFDFGAVNEKRTRDRRRKKDTGAKRDGGREVGRDLGPRAILQAPVILERRERPDGPKLPAQQDRGIARRLNTDAELSTQDDVKESTVVKMMNESEEFRTEATLRALADYPGHFVVGIIGKQGVGKSTILSSFAEQPDKTFNTQKPAKIFDHQTTGIDMYVTSERIILLDTQPVLSWSVIEQTLRHGSTDGLSSDIWRDLKTLHSIMFMLSVSDVVLVVSEGAEADLDTIRCLKRADMLKHGLPEFPLISPEKLGFSRPDIHLQPQVVFVNNKCQDLQFSQLTYDRNIQLLQSMLSDSRIEWQGLISFASALPRFKRSPNRPNLFLLPYTSNLTSKDEEDEDLESLDDLLRQFRNQVFAAPRKSGKRGQISERDWFRNAVKTYDLILRSDLISEYLRTLRRIKNG
ncbi:hypothetical protein INT43_001587 [Umbelopsis isabellina]|uniref:Protein SMG9 n=1 Tax=Mortierella isabellina TaxID=91625 RepID=A0A8H7PT32_MORIS|nr:hypothetical protein INT43_001587 [Umbelopsis isabellina]